MLILKGFSPAWNAIDLSPYVVKLATWLRMVEQPFQLETGDLRKTPRGKLPALVMENGETWVDSQEIIQRLGQQLGDPLGEAKLTALQRAQAHAVQALLESEAYFAAVYLRWVPDDSWASLQPEVVRYLRTIGVPGLLTGTVSQIVRKKTIAQVQQQGTGRRPAKEVLAIACQAYADLSTLLGERPYWQGDQATAIDATLFAFIHVVLGSTPQASLTQALHAQVSRLDNLVAFHNRMLHRYWPERA